MVRIVSYGKSYVTQTQLENNITGFILIKTMLGHIYSFVKTAYFCLQAIAFLHLEKKEQKRY